MIGHERVPALDSYFIQADLQPVIDQSVESHRQMTLDLILKIEIVLDSEAAPDDAIQIFPKDKRAMVQSEEKMQRAATHLTGRLRFFSKSNVASNASSCATHYA